uniref:F-box domain-containing protein n=1 Tax=Leersia perrieri TaxID=77586 RepID=A0A0D9W292_9ORYZ
MSVTSVKRTVPDWSNGLPQDLLKFISNMLTSGQDVSSFHSVCNTWRDVLPFERFTPILMLSFHPELHESSITFCNMIEEKTIVMSLPEVNGKVACGASHAWVAVMDEAPSVILLNPFTSSHRSVFKEGGDG